MARIKYTVIHDELRHVKYARIDHPNTVDFLDVCKKASEHCKFPASVVKAVGEGIIETMIDYILLGNRVEFGRLAAFYAKVHKVENDKLNPDTGQYEPVADTQMVPSREDLSLHCEVLRNKTVKNMFSKSHFKQNNDSSSLKRTIRPKPKKKK